MKKIKKKPKHNLLKKKNYYSGVALVALICASSVSQSMEPDTAIDAVARGRYVDVRISERIIMEKPLDFMSNQVQCGGKNTLEMRDLSPLRGSDHIPIINLNDEFQGDSMIEACLKHGFFYVDNRQGQEVPIELIEELQQRNQDFFQLPTPIKEAYAIEKSKFHRGYIGFSSAPKSYEDSNIGLPQENYCESLGYGAPLIFRNTEDEANDGNVYPRELGAQFELNMKQYMKKCLGIRDKILMHLKPYLRLDLVKSSEANPKNWQDAFHKPMWTLRNLHYPSCEGKLTPHTDFGVLTILHQDQTGGLQIWFKNQWIDVPPIQNTFIINVGDILQEWSGGVLKSTRHQVIHKGLQDRYSMAFFAHLSKDMQVYSIEKKEWISQYEHLMQKYYKFTSYLSERVKNPDNCLQGKSPDQIDSFHQHIIATRALKNEYDS